METKTARSLYYNPGTDTLDIWLGDPSSETLAEPITENIVGKRNRRGEILASRQSLLANSTART
jgi:hypothetical protein